MTRRLVNRTTARVFCHGPHGGNPVTVFSTPDRLGPHMQKKLAMECDWESVMVATSSHDMAFYMPAGDEVSFCAHAAIGGAFATLPSTASSFLFQQQMDGTQHTVHVVPKAAADNNDDDDDDENHGSMMRLDMEAPFEESEVSHKPSWIRLLREQCGIHSKDLTSQSSTRPLPTLVNSSIARPKTLIYVNSPTKLHEAKPPPPERFSKSTIDEITTGIYLYSCKENEPNAWECRQFPKNSGYPEDPATGIAAAALAVSLHKAGIQLPLFTFYQGTAMGRPSLLEVVDLHTSPGNMVEFGLQGTVIVDSHDTIEVDESEEPSS